MLSATLDFLMNEQSVYITIWFCLGKVALETPEIFITAFGDNVMGRKQNFEKFSSVENCKRSGRPSTGGTKENLDRAREIINESVRNTIYIAARVTSNSKKTFFCMFFQQ